MVRSGFRSTRRSSTILGWVGEGLKGLVRSKSKGNPTVVALRGSDLIRKSPPAAMAAAVYSKQQEDLKLPEEVRQKKFGEGGVGGDHLQLIGDKTTSGLVELGKITKRLRRRLRVDEAERPREDRGARALPRPCWLHVRGRGGAARPGRRRRRATTAPGTARRRPRPAPPASPRPTRSPVRPVPSRPTAGFGSSSARLEGENVTRRRFLILAS